MSRMVIMLACACSLAATSAIAQPGLLERLGPVLNQRPTLMVNPTGPARFYGIYRAQVVNSVDPLMRGRLQVLAPDVSNTAVWAEAVFPHGQPQPSWQGLPQPGAIVWVVYEAGDGARPVWLGVPGRTGG